MRKFVASLLAVVMVLSLAACGKKDDGGNTQVPAQNTPAESENVGIPVQNLPIGGDTQHDESHGVDIDTGRVDVPGDSSSEIVEEPPVDAELATIALDASAGEVTISSQFFNKSKIIAYDIRSNLGQDFDWVQDSVADNMATICNTYSIEGLSRTMAVEGFPDGGMKEEAVILCYITGIPYEEAWANGFWTREDVEAVVAKIIGGNKKPDTLMIDKDAGEKTIADAKYSGEDMSIESLRKMFNVDGAQVRDNVLTLALNFINNYSQEGFLRTLAESSPETTEMGQAAVLVCRLLGIPMEMVFEHDYMSEKNVEKMVDLLDNAEKSDPIYQD